MPGRGRGDDWELDDAAAVQPPPADPMAVGSAEKLEALQPGEYVKLRFRLRRPPPGGPPGERMWVRVVARERGGYRGILENEPQAIKGLAKGDEVRFGPEHVLSIWEAIPEETPVAFVNRRLLEYDELVPAVACHDPAEEERPVLPDGRRSSGWQLLVGDETAEELDDPEAFTLAAVADLASRYPAFGALVASGEEGRVYAWDGEAGNYVDHGPYESPEEW
jgi:hypothetical protein